jgi:hypothetical protein
MYCPACVEKIISEWAVRKREREKGTGTATATQSRRSRVNKGLTKETSQEVKEYSKARKKAWEKARKDGTATSWNKGLKAAKDKRVADNVEKTRQRLLDLYENGTIVPWNKGKEHPKVKGDKCPSKRLEVRIKLREASIKIRKNLKKFGYKGKGNFNPRACELFNIINKEMNWNGQHALNGGEYKVLGYYLDFYEPTLNLVIEYDEKHHNKTREIKKDKIRQELIIGKLNCKFFRIKEKEEEKWKENLILYLSQA